MTDGAPDKQPRPASSRVLIPCTCSVHRTAVGFANLVVRKLYGAIELDVHAAGACTVVLDETAATALHTTLGQWLG